ncbi:MAG: hypothetical protein EBU90_01605 [Proteobacteria bacterium]|nr:hypothetical protein [Pseudomonadota bacterium]
MAKQTKISTVSKNPIDLQNENDFDVLKSIGSGINQYSDDINTGLLGKDNYQTSQYDTNRMKFDDMSNVYDVRNANQGIFDRLGNAAGKIGTRALSSTVDLAAMVSGAGASAFPLYAFDKYVLGKHKNTSGLWDMYKESVFDNSITDIADAIQSWGDENFQQQYSSEERNNDGVSVKRILGEGLPDAIGFIASAFLTGGSGVGAKLVGSAAKTVTGVGLLGKGLNTIKASNLFGKVMTVFPQETKALLSAAAKGADVTADVAKLAAAAKNTATWNLAKSAFIGSLGEASQEGRATRKEVEAELVKNYMRENGIANEEDIDVFTRESLRSAATDAGVANFAINTSILTLSNLIAFPAYFKRFQQGKRELGEFINKGLNADDVVDLVKKSTGKRVGDAAKRYAKSFITQGLPESAQELAQTMSSTGVNNYYSNRFSEKDAEEATDMFSGGLKLFLDTIGSTEGLEGMIVGGLVGGAPAIAANEINRGKEREQAKELVTALNNTQAKSQYPRLFKGIVDNLATQKEKDSAIAADDIFTFKNADHKQIFDYMNLRLDLGREEDILNDIDNLKTADPKILDQLFGAENSSVEGFSYADIASKLEEKLSAIKKTRDKINLNYTTLDQETKNQLMYFASAVENFDKRENNIVEQLAKETGVSADSIRETYKNYKDTDTVDYKDVILREARKKFNVNPVLDTLDTLADSLGLTDTTKKSFLDFEAEKKKTEPDFKTDLDSLFKIITGEAESTSSLFSGDTTKPANSEKSSIIDEVGFINEYKSLVEQAQKDYEQSKLVKRTRAEPKFPDKSGVEINEKINKTFSDLKKVANTRETYYKYYTELSRNPFAQARFKAEAEQDKKRYDEYISKIITAPVVPAVPASEPTRTLPNQTSTNTSANQKSNRISSAINGSVEPEEMPTEEELGKLGISIFKNQPPAKPTGEITYHIGNPDGTFGIGLNKPNNAAHMFLLEKISPTEAIVNLAVGNNSHTETSLDYIINDIKDKFDKFIKASGVSFEKAENIKQTKAGKAELVNGVWTITEKVEIELSDKNGNSSSTQNSNQQQKSKEENKDSSKGTDKKTNNQTLKEALAKVVSKNNTISLNEKEDGYLVKGSRKFYRRTTSVVGKDFDGESSKQTNQIELGNLFDVAGKVIFSKAVITDLSIEDQNKFSNVSVPIKEELVKIRTSLESGSSSRPKAVNFYTGLKLANTNGLNIAGEIDLLVEYEDGSLQIVDFKSTSRTNYLVDNYLPQLSLYQVLLQRELGLGNVKFREPAIINIATQEDPQNSKLRKFVDNSVKVISLAANKEELLKAEQARAFLSNLLNYEGFTDDYFSLPENQNDLDAVAKHNEELLKDSKLSHEVELLDNGITKIYAELPNADGEKENRQVSFVHTDSTLKSANIRAADALLSEIENDTWASKYLLKNSIKTEIRQTVKKLNNVENVRKSLKKGVRNKLSIKVSYSPNFFVSKNWKDQKTLSEFSKDGKLPKGSYVYQSLRKQDRNTYGVISLNNFDTPKDLNSTAPGLNSTFPKDKWILVLPKADAEKLPSTVALRPLPIYENDGTTLTKTSKQKLDALRKLADTQLVNSEATEILNSLAFIPTQKKYDVNGEKVNYDLTVSVSGKSKDAGFNNHLDLTYQVTYYKYENQEYVPVDFTFKGKLDLGTGNSFEFLLDLPKTPNDGKKFDGSEFFGKTNEQVFNELLEKDGNKGVLQVGNLFALNRSSFLLGRPTSADELIPLLNQDNPVTVIKDFAESAVGSEIENFSNEKPATSINQLIAPETVQAINDQSKSQDEYVPFSLISGNQLISPDLIDIKNRLSKILPSSVEVNSIMSMMQKLNLTGQELGLVYNNAIYLANKIEKGTEYHEAFHIVFRSILSESQRAEILKEEFNSNPVSQEEIDSFKNLHPSYKFLTDEETLERILEERLADKFQTYQVKKDETSLLGKFFNYLKNLVSSLFKNKNKIDTLFNSISDGKFRNSALSYNGKPVLFKALPLMMVTESDYLVRWVSSEVAKDFVNKEQGDDLNEAKENAYEGLTDQYLEKLSNKYYLEAGIELSAKSYDQLDVATKQYYVPLTNGTYVPRSEFLSSETKSRFLAELKNEVLNKFNNYAYFDSDLADINAGASETADLKNYEAENNTVGGLDSINKKVTGWLDSISYVNDFGRKIMINVPQVHAKLITNLADSLSGEELITKLEKIAGTKDKVRDKELFAVLEAYKSSEMKKEIQLLFLNSYNKAYMDSVTTLLNTSMKDIKLDMVETNGTFVDGSTKLVNENNRAALREYLGNFSSNFSLIVNNKNKKLVDKTLYEEFLSISQNIQALADSEKEPVLQRMQQILDENLGLTLSIETLRENYVLTNNQDTKEVKDSIAQIVKLVSENGLNPFLDDNKSTNNRSRLQKIILSEMKFSLDPISALTYKDATNKNRYAITGMYEEKKRLLRFQRDSSFLRSIIDNDYFKFSSMFSSGNEGKISKELNSIRLTFVNGISYKKTKNNGKRTFKDFNSTDHILSKISLYEKGYISPFVHESGSTQTAYDLSELFKKDGLLDKTVSALDKTNRKNKKLTETFATQFINILKQDVYLAIENEKLLRKAVRKQAQLVKLSKSSNKNVSEAAKEALFQESYLDGLVSGLSFEYEKNGESFVYDEDGNRVVKFLKNPKHRSFNSIAGEDLFKIVKDKINELGAIENEKEFNSDLITYLTDRTEKGAGQVTEINQIFSNSKDGKYAPIFQALREEVHNVINKSVKKELKFARDQGVDYSSFFKATEGIGVYEKAEDYLYEKAVRSFLGSFYVNQLITGYSGAHINFKNNVDIAKRSKDKTSSGMDMSNYAYVNNSEESINFAIIPDDISKSSEKESSNATDYEIISTDGAAYVTANFMKMYLKSTVGISPKQEEILDIISDKFRWYAIVKAGGIRNYINQIFANDPEYSKALNSLDLAPKKSFVANPGEYDVLTKGGEMFKDASFFLSPELVFTIENGKLVSRKGMEKQADLLKNMAKFGIDSAVYVSSSKASKRNLSVVHPTDSSKMFLKSIPISLQHIKEQVRMESGKLKVVHGTQLIELIDINSVSPEKRDEYQDLLAKSRESVQNLYSLSRKLVTKNGLTVFANSINNQLESKKRNINVMKLMSGETTANNEHKFKFSVDLPITSSLFEEAFSSFFGKNVNRQKVAGLKLTLAPSKGMTYEVTKDGKPTYNAIRRDDSKYNYEKLKVHRYEDGTFKFAEVLISEEILDDMKLSRKDFLALSEKDQQKALQMIGYRIPTQAAHSIIPIKVVGILPKYYGSTVYMNEEAVAIMGADYDIDSLFVFRKKIQSVSTINAETKEKTTRLLTHELNEKDRIDSWLQYMYSEKKFKGFLERYAETRSKETGNTISLKDIFTIDQEKIKLFGKLQGIGIVSSDSKDPNYYSPFQQQNRILELNLEFIQNMGQKELEEVALRPAGTSLVKDVADKMADFLGFNKKDDFGFNFPSEQQESQIRNTVGKKNVGNAVSVGVAALAVAKNESVVANLSTSFGLNTIDNSDSYEPEMNFDTSTGMISLSEEGRKVSKQLAISDLSSSSTDDAKENNAYKLNITEFTIKRVSAGIAVGLGITRSLLLNTTPIMKYIANFDRQGEDVNKVKANFLKNSAQFTKGYTELAKKPILLDRENPIPALERLNEMLEEGINFFKTDTGKVVREIMKNTDSFMFSDSVRAELKTKLNAQQKQDFGLFLINQTELLYLSDYLGDVATLLLEYRKVNSKGNKEVGITLADYQEIVENYESYKEKQERILTRESFSPSIVRQDGKIAITRNGEAIYRNAIRVLKDSENYTLKTNRLFRKSFMSTKGMFFTDRQKKEKALIDSFFTWFNIQAAKRRSATIADTKTLAKEYLFSKENNVAKKINTLIANNPELQKLLKNNIFWKKLEITEIDETKGILAAEIKFPSYSSADAMVEERIIEDAAKIFTPFKIKDIDEENRPLAENLLADLKTLREYLTNYELLRSGLSYKNNSYTSKLPASIFQKQSEFLDKLRTIVFAEPTQEEINFLRTKNGNVLDKISIASRKLYYILNPNAESEPYELGKSETLWKHRTNYFSIYFKKTDNRMALSSIFGEVTKNESNIDKILSSINSEFSGTNFGLSEKTSLLEVTQSESGKNLKFSLSENLLELLTPENRSEFLSSLGKSLFFKDGKYELSLPMVIRMSYSKTPHIYIRTNGNENTYTRVEKIDGLEYLPFDINSFSSGKELDEFINTPEVKAYLADILKKKQENSTKLENSAFANETSSNPDDDVDFDYVREATSEELLNEENKIGRKPLVNTQGSSSVIEQTFTFATSNPVPEKKETSTIFGNIHALQSDAFEPMNGIDSSSNAEPMPANEQRRSIEQKISLNATETILKKLSSKFRLPYSFVSSSGNWIARFNLNTGKIEVNQNAEIGLDTPFHEFAHPFLIAIQQSRPELYNSLIDQILEEKETLARISESYSDLSQEQIIMEAIVTKIGEMAAGIYKNKKEQSLFEKVISEIKSIISSILGINEDFVSLDNATSLFDLAEIMNDNNSYDLSSLFNQNKETHLAKLKMAVSSLIKSDNLTFSCK